MYSSQYPYFSVYRNQQYIVVRAEPNMYSKIHVIIDDQKVTTYYPDVDFYLPKSLIPSGTHFLYLIGDYTIGRNPCSVQACYIIDVEKKNELRGKGEHDYRPGDILVPSDNKKGIPDGYMGHAAIIVDGDYILESDYSKDSIAITVFVKIVVAFNLFYFYISTALRLLACAKRTEFHSVLFAQVIFHWI